MARCRSAISAVAVRRGSMTTTLMSRCLARRGQPLIEDRMAPGEVRSDQHDEIGEFEILVGAGHGVGAEGPLVAGDGGRHAQARVRVDVGRADEALHQLVGDVVVLGQDLAGRIDRDAIGAVRVDRFAEAARHEIECGWPIRRLAMRDRLQQAIAERQRFAECCALRAQAAEVRGMIGVALDFGGLGGPSPSMIGRARTPQPTPQ